MKHPWGSGAVLPTACLQGRPHSHPLKTYLHQLLLPSASCTDFNNRTTRQGKRQEKNSVKKQNKSEPESDMAEILELSDHEIKINIINMVMAAMKKVDNM